MLRHLAARAESGASVVAVAGGDGTLGVAARALCNTETVLAPFPAGTMNVFPGKSGSGKILTTPCMFWIRGVTGTWTCSPSTGSPFSRWRA